MLNGQQAQGNSFGKGEKVAGYYTQTMVVQELVAQALETATVDGKAINQRMLPCAVAMMSYVVTDMNNQDVGTKNFQLKYLGQLFRAADTETTRKILKFAEKAELIKRPVRKTVVNGASQYATTGMDITLGTKARSILRDAKQYKSVLEIPGFMDAMEKQNRHNRKKATAASMTSIASYAVNGTNPPVFGREETVAECASWLQVVPDGDSESEPVITEELVEKLEREHRGHATATNASNSMQSHASDANRGTKWTKQDQKGPDRPNHNTLKRVDHNTPKRVDHNTLKRVPSKEHSLKEHLLKEQLLRTRAKASVLKMTRTTGDEKIDRMIDAAIRTYDNEQLLDPHEQSDEQVRNVLIEAAKGMDQSEVLEALCTALGTAEYYWSHEKFHRFSAVEHLGAALRGRWKQDLLKHVPDCDPEWKYSEDEGRCCFLNGTRETVETIKYAQLLRRYEAVTDDPSTYSYAVNRYEAVVNDPDDYFTAKDYTNALQGHTEALENDPVIADDVSSEESSETESEELALATSMAVHQAVNDICSGKLRTGKDKDREIIVGHQKWASIRKRDLNTVPEATPDVGEDYWTNNWRTGR